MTRQNRDHIKVSRKNTLIIITMFFACFFATHAEQLSLNKMQQAQTISGVVQDQNGEPVTGATVLEKGNSNNGTITDINGVFSIQVAPNSLLKISYIGYITQEVNVGNDKSLKITLYEDMQNLEEVVVIGYGIQKKVNLTGSVSSIDIAREALGRPITTLSAGLAGLAPGLYVRSATNDPGSSATLMLRGQGTLNNSAPLVIVDGVESSMDNVSPHDVASISILKDAASASIYGSRAANGVILITTKQGAVGKVQINYNGYGAFQSVGNLMPLIDNSVEFMEMINEAARNSNLAEPYSKGNIELWRANQGGDPLLWPNTNWGEALFRNIFTNNHNISVSGGTDKIKSYVSLDYSDSPGIIENTGFSGFIVRANNEFKPTKWMRVGANLSGVFTRKDRGSQNLSSLFTNSVGAVPTVVVKSSDGRYGGTNNVEENQAVASPLWYINYYKGDNTTHKFFSKFFVTLTPVEGLTINASYFYDFHTNKVTTAMNQNDRWNFQTNTILVSGKVALSIGKSESRNSKNFMDTDISYEKTVFDKLNFRIMAGASQEQFFSESMAVTRLDLIDENLTEIDAASGTSTSSGSRTEWAMRSFFGRLNLNWDEKYLLELNLRRDGSSRFALDNRWGNFPSVSAGWRLSEESFLESLRESGLDNLKIRVSYGSLGNNSIGNYVHIPTLGQTTYSFNDAPVIGFYQNAIANANVSWESTFVTNIGLDFNLFKDLSGSVEHYNKLTKDILMSLPAPYAHGAASIPAVNSAEVRNRGIEITLGWQSKIQDVGYYINGNFTYNKNEVVKFKGDEYQLSGTSMIKEGLPINVQYIRKVDRIVQTREDLDLVQGMIDNAPALENGTKANPFPYGRPELGDLLYKDLDNNGIINDDDREVYGNGPNPQYMYGISFGASYKGFDFSALIQGVAGLEEYFRNDYFSPVLRYSIIVNREIVDGRWYEGRTSPANYPRLMMSDSRNIMESDFWVFDKSYLKIRNIQIGYTIPQKILSPFSVNKLRIYAGLENFFTFTKWKGLDPEVGGVNYPTMKQVVFGANLSF
jgi:TonB-linked SusC/RagA family outer membrane protein